MIALLRHRILVELTLNPKLGTRKLGDSSPTLPLLVKKFKQKNFMKIPLEYQENDLESAGDASPSLRMLP